MSTEKCLSGTAIHHPLISDYSNAYMEFVASSTSDICVKYFWAWVKLSKINATNYPVKFAEIRLEFSQDNWSEFVLGNKLHKN